nr:hypothetical protein [Nitrosomonas nitrosa]
MSITKSALESAAAKIELRQPSTRAELNARIEQRRRPELEAHCTPGGGIEFEVHRELDMRNERRIAFLAARLGSQRDHAARDFMQSRGEALPRQEQPRPRRSFEHAR